MRITSQCNDENKSFWFFLIPARFRYELTIEPGTKLERSVTAQETKLPCSEQRADEWVLVKETLECLGFERYEVSNFARNGRRSRHNEAVWRGSMYAGVGPGEHMTKKLSSCVG